MICLRFCALMVGEVLPVRNQQESFAMTSVGVKTNEELLRRLQAAARRVLTKEELHRQRVSFIYGSLPDDSTVTRNQIECVLARIEGEAAAD